jgi:hypothetical protein
VSKIITLNREDRQKAIYDDLCYITEQAMKEPDELSDEGKAILATFINVLGNMITPVGEGRVTLVPAMTIIETAARTIRASKAVEPKEGEKVN